LVEYEHDAPGGDHIILFPFAETAMHFVPPADAPPGADAKFVHDAPLFVE
jgi:hypothetical protein